MQKLMALLAPVDDDGGVGDGAPDGGSPKGGQDNLPDGESVPKTQFIAALNNANRKYEALEAELAELRAQVKAPADPPRTYTRAELTAAVAEGKITQEQADAELQRQSDDRAHRVALETISGERRKEFIDSQIARYTDVAPEILDDAHDTRKRIKEEYNSLVKLGDNPRDVATQLKAIRAVLGPIERLEKSRSGRTQYDTHREAGGGGGGGGRPDPKTGKLADQLRPGARAYYEDGIKKGRYKDWEAVESELKFASPASRQRLGIA